LLYLKVTNVRSGLLASTSAASAASTSVDVEDAALEPIVPTPAKPFSKTFTVSILANLMYAIEAFTLCF
jgi:hypothetical protein